MGAEHTRLNYFARQNLVYPIGQRDIDITEQSIPFVREVRDAGMLEQLRDDRARVLRILSCPGGVEELDTQGLLLRSLGQVSSYLPQAGESTCAREQRIAAIQEARDRYLAEMATKHKPGLSKEAADLTLRRYAITSERLLDELTNGPLHDVAMKTDRVNEVQNKWHPVDLALVALNNRWPSKARFEALRKIRIIELASKLDRELPRHVITEEQERIDDFFAENVWNPDKKTAETERQFIVSTHSESDYKCIAAEIFDTEEEALHAANGQVDKRVTPLSMREFCAIAQDQNKTGATMPVMFDTRVKDDTQKVLKMIRKGTPHPRAAIQDTHGFMGVFFSERHLRKFRELIEKKAQERGIGPEITDLEDNLHNGNEYSAQNGGSSPKLRMCKYMLETTDFRVEVMAFTLKNFLDYMYRDGVSHKEYEATRFFATGSADFFFPQSVYGINFDQALLGKTLERIRRETRINIR